MRKNKYNVDHDKWIDDIIKWADEADPDKLGRWEEFVNLHLKYLGWNKQARKDFFAWGEYGFNMPFIPDGPEDYADFYDEVGYCSDRMSLDRLFRCHVVYRHIKLEGM